MVKESVNQAKAKAKAICSHHAYHLEHHGFIAYATFEVLHLQSLVWFAALWLSVTGVLVFIGDKWGGQ